MSEQKTRCKKSVWDDALRSMCQCQYIVWKDGFCRKHYSDVVADRRASEKANRAAISEHSIWLERQRANARIAKLEAEVARLKGGA